MPKQADCTDDCYDMFTYCDPEPLRRHANYCPNHSDYDRHMALREARAEVDMVDVNTGLAKLDSWSPISPDFSIA